MSYWFGTRIYYRITGDAILRIERKLDDLEERWQKRTGDSADLLESLKDIRKLLEIHGRNKPGDPEFFYYQGLLDFYELALRAPLDGDSLVQLSGRGYLPQPAAAEEGRMGIAALALRISREMRKALALEPELKHSSAAHLALVYGDLFYTGRTDPQLLELLARAKAEELSGPQLALRDWIGMALYSILGKNGELTALAAQVAAPAAAGAVPRLALSERARILILAHGALHSRDYLQALYLARQVKQQSTESPLYASEAARLEGEVFLVQRGKLAALPYFEQALQLAGGADPFLEERIEAVKPATP
ncbi:MAG: hypothetical protein K1X75_16630 [Leptospirales bacterium]|nr:hypothetical protein [Leptospirales bacterium]